MPFTTENVMDLEPAGRVHLNGRKDDSQPLEHAGKTVSVTPKMPPNTSSDAQDPSNEISKGADPESRVWNASHPMGAGLAPINAAVGEET